MDVYKKILPEAKEMSNRLVDEIAAVANTKSTAMVAEFAGLTSSLVMETMFISVAADNFEIGSAEGADWISAMYHQALRDALNQWYNPEPIESNNGVTH